MGFGCLWMASVVALFCFSSSCCWYCLMCCCSTYIVVYRLRTIPLIPFTIILCIPKWLLLDHARGIFSMIYRMVCIYMYMYINVCRNSIDVLASLAHSALTLFCMYFFLLSILVCIRVKCGKAHRKVEKKCSMLHLRVLYIQNGMNVGWGCETHRHTIPYYTCALHSILFYILRLYTRYVFINKSVQVLVYGWILFIIYFVCMFFLVAAIAIATTLLTFRNIAKMLLPLHISLHLNVEWVGC